MARTFDAVQGQRPEVRLLVIGYCNVAIEKLVAGGKRPLSAPAPFPFNDVSGLYFCLRYWLADVV